MVLNLIVSGLVIVSSFSLSEDPLYIYLLLCWHLILSSIYQLLCLFISPICFFIRHCFFLFIIRCFLFLRHCCFLFIIRCFWLDIAVSCLSAKLCLLTNIFPMVHPLFLSPVTIFRGRKVAWNITFSPDLHPDFWQIGAFLYILKQFFTWLAAISIVPF